MKLSTSGKITHFYFVSGGWLTKAIIVLSILLVSSTVLILSVPEFSIHQPNFRISSNHILAIAQVAVGAVFLGSMAGGVALGASVVFWFWPEIICEIALRKKTLKVIQARKRISLSDLAEEVGVYEGELGILLKHWVAARNKFHIDPVKRTFSGNHLNMDLVNKEISWEE